MRVAFPCLSGFLYCGAEETVMLCHWSILVQAWCRGHDTGSHIADIVEWSSCNEVFKVNLCRFYLDPLIRRRIVAANYQGSVAFVQRFFIEVQHERWMQMLY